jgi:hypothetical protein
MMSIDEEGRGNATARGNALATWGKHGVTGARWFGKPFCRSMAFHPPTVPLRLKNVSDVYRREGEVRVTR